MGLLEPPAGFVAAEWCDRWDRMQERHLVRRSERLGLIVDVIARSQGRAPVVLDLGCGTGSLAAAVLEGIAGARCVALDVDPTLLLLAESRLGAYSGRARLVTGDLRDTEVLGGLEGPLDAIVSSTALHWLDEASLERLYAWAAEALREGGVFLNADHVGSDRADLQALWVECRARELTSSGAASHADDWAGFWEAYGAALGPDAMRHRAEALGEWEGIEDGLPLIWHLDRLRSAGFRSVECFWRADCDAIYGGFR
jgi:SAM-dependent methyltransferase